MVCLQCKSCVICAWALQKWSISLEALYKCPATFTFRQLRSTSASWRHLFIHRALETDHVYTLDLSVGGALENAVRLFSSPLSLLSSIIPYSPHTLFRFNSFFPFYFYFYLVCLFLYLFEVIMFGAPELWWWGALANLLIWFDLIWYCIV